MEFRTLEERFGEFLKTIADAEKVSQETIAWTREEASKIVAKAAMKSKALEELAEKILEEIEKEIMTETEKKIKEMREEYRRVIEEEKKLLRKRMDENLEEVVNYVVNEVFKI